MKGKKVSHVAKNNLQIVENFSLRVHDILDICIVNILKKSNLEESVDRINWWSTTRGNS